MKGFKITFNGITSTIPAIEDGLSIIHISTVHEETTIYVSTIEYDTQIENIWYHFAPVELGDVIKITMMDIDNVSVPQKRFHDKNIKRPAKSRLERFYEFEASLKKQGLL